MKDGIIAETGNSRLVRANLPATYEEMRAQAAAGTLPMDILFNAAGWSQQPDFLSKNTLLKDTTAALFGGDSAMLPDEALAAIKNLIDASNANAETKAKFACGTFAGASSAQTLNLPFEPDIVIIIATDGRRYSYLMFSTKEGFTFGLRNLSDAISGSSVSVLISGSTVTVSDLSDADCYYVAFG